MYLCVYIYIYIYRERERERENLLQLEDAAEGQGARVEQDGAEAEGVVDQEEA